MGLLDTLGSTIASEAAKNIGDIFTGLAGAIAQFVNTPEDKIKVQTLLQDGQQKALAEANRHAEASISAQIALEQSEDDNVTKRAQIDMTSDNKLSKNIRPLMLAYLSVVITLLAIFDSILVHPAVINAMGVITTPEVKVLNIKDNWVYLFGGAFMSALGYYFVTRSIEKINAIRQDQK